MATRQSGKRKLNSRARVAIAILAAVLVLSLVVVALLQSEQRVESHALAFSKNDSYAFSDRGVVYITDHTLYFDDLAHGKANWRRQLKTPGFKVAASNSFIVVYSDHMAQALDYGNNLLTSTMQFSSTVLDVRCGENYFAILRQDADGKFEISRISTSGEQLTPLGTDNFYVTNYNYYANDQLWLMSMDQASNVPVTRISTFSGADARTGVMTLEEELVSSVYVSDFLFAAGTKTLRAYTPTGKQQDSRSVYGWQVLDHISNKTGNFFLLRSELALSDPSQTSQGRLISLPQIGNDIDIRFPAHFVAAFLQNGKIIMLSRDTAYVFQMDGTLHDTVPLDIEIDAAYKVSSTRIMVTSASESGPRCYWMVFGL